MRRWFMPSKHVAALASDRRLCQQPEVHCSMLARALTLLQAFAARKVPGFAL